METLIPILLSLVFGGVAATVVSHLLTTYRSDKEFRLRKLEEIYIKVHKEFLHHQTCCNYCIQFDVNIYPPELKEQGILSTYKPGFPRFALQINVTQIL